jgi:acetyl esterase
VQRVLAGKRITIDGQTLATDTQLMLRLEKLAREPAVASLPVEQGRRVLVQQTVIAGGAQPIGAVRDLPVGERQGRLFVPTGAPPTGPLLVFFHGGGWVYGDLDSHDPVCRFLAERSGVRVLSVDYRLAPEHPYPAAVDDVVAAFAWAARHAEDLGADPTRLAVAGDSAGGNLAAVVAQVTRDAGTTQPVAQLLIYPGTDSSRRRPSKDLFAEGFFLTKKQMDWYWDTYSAGGSRTDPRLSPLCADTLVGLAPAVVTTAAFDPLRDEGEAYAAALRDAGVPVVLRRATGLVHGYFSMTGIHRASLDESLAVCGAFAGLLDTHA